MIGSPLGTQELMAKTALKQRKKKLDAREKRFKKEYLIDLKPERAALAAGYSKTTAKTKAYMWVSDSKFKPHLYEAIQKEMKKRSKRTEITADRVLEELAKIGFEDMGDFAKWGVGGVELTESDQLGDKTRCVQEVREKAKILSQDDGDVVLQRDVTFKLHDKRAALMDLGRHLGLFNKDKSGGFTVVLKPDEIDKPEDAGMRKEEGE